VATPRHLKNPARTTQPRALDHSAIGFSWHRDGKPVAYALNGYRADQFADQAEPFAVDVADSRVERDGSGYKLTVVTPTVEGRPILAEFRFRPADSTEPFERDLGTPEAPHNWILAASDCRVDGKATIGDQSLSFTGRGYHDHNAGAEDLSIAMKRWEWGRVHHGSFTDIYYESIPRQGASQELWITCRDGRPETIREGEELRVWSLRQANRPGSGWNVFGLRHDVRRGYESEGLNLWRMPDLCLDDGPFYRRWVTHFEVDVETEDDVPTEEARGISELLVTRNLHSPLFNWMIPYRLKRPRS